MPALLDCLARSMPHAAIDRAGIERRVLLDRHFEADGFLVVDDPGTACACAESGAVAAFAACFAPPDPARPATGYVSLMAIAPGPAPNNGTLTGAGAAAGDALLAGVRRFHEARSRTEVLLSPYAANYFTPGPDKQRDAALIAFLASRGFVETGEALAADACIATFDMPPDALAAEARLAAESVVVRPYGRGDMARLMEFHRTHMPAPWVEDLRVHLLEMTAGRVAADSVWIAEDHSASTIAAASGMGDCEAPILGFCMHDGEHFGPFGVVDSAQGRGLGTVLLARTLHRMRTKGLHGAWVLWTGERALAGVYGRLGFTLTRRSAIMRWALHP